MIQYMDMQHNPDTGGHGFTLCYQCAVLSISDVVSLCRAWQLVMH